MLPPLALPLLCLSKRLHSIYILRLFNDGPAMLLAYCATALLVTHHWVPAIVAFSAAVSVKMNVLLMAPSVLLIVLKVRHLVPQVCPGTYGLNAVLPRHSPADKHCSCFETR